MPYRPGRFPHLCHYTKGAGSPTRPVTTMSANRTSISSSLVPSIALEERSMVGRMLSAMLSRWPEMTRGSPPESNYLRRDIGLHPFETRRNYWDHQ